MTDALAEIFGEDSPKYTQACRQFERLEVMATQIENLISEDSIVKLADFNVENHIHYLLETDYAMEAYEEELDYYVGLASDRASSKLYELCEGAHQDLDSLLEQSNLFYTLYGKIISLFSGQQLKKVSPTIDNT